MTDMSDYAGVPTLRILQLYPHAMNIYGDWGNVLTLKKRAEWHGYGAEVVSYNPGDEFPTDVDIIVGGGGQDSGPFLYRHIGRLDHQAGAKINQGALLG